MQGGRAQAQARGARRCSGKGLRGQPCLRSGAGSARRWRRIRSTLASRGQCRWEEAKEGDWWKEVKVELQRKEQTHTLARGGARVQGSRQSMHTTEEARDLDRQADKDPPTATCQWLG